MVIENGRTAAPRSSRFAPTDRFLRIIEDPWYRCLVDIQDRITTTTIDFFSRQGLKNLHLPLTTHSISSPMGLGSDSLPVQIDLFGVETYLADSMQFMLEYGCRLNRAGACYIMPSFRGENSDATHLCQFFHSEAEIPGGLDDVMELVERYLRHMTKHIFADVGDQIRDVLGGNVSHILEFLNASEIARVTMDEAVMMLGHDDALVRTHTEGFHTLTRAGERELMDRYGGFLWLVKPDHLSVPFYQAFADPQGKKALAADLLIGMGETVGAGERHATADEVALALERHHVDAAPYEWYVAMREAYPMQTSGFGLGTERYICWLLQHDDIRDCQLLERENGESIIP